MEKINRKQFLLRALDSGGLVFTGCVGDAVGQELAKSVNSRCARVVLRRIAAGLRGDRMEVGTAAGAVVLAGDLYKPRQVWRALAALTAAGVVERVRQGRRGQFWEKEPPAKNFIHTAVIDAAVAWSLEWRTRPGCKPEPRAVEVPLSPTPPLKDSTGAASSSGG